MANTVSSRALALKDKLYEKAFYSGRSLGLALVYLACSRRGQCKAIFSKDRCNKSARGTDVENSPCCLWEWSLLGKRRDREDRWKATLLPTSKPCSNGQPNGRHGSTAHQRIPIRSGLSCRNGSVVELSKHIPLQADCSIKLLRAGAIGLAEDRRIELISKDKRCRREPTMDGVICDPVQSGVAPRGYH